jgi:tRNA threonylcarbamoyladenosine biosynthesis protein TsaE
MPSTAEHLPWPLDETTVGAGETAALGGRLASALRAGDLVLVAGELGAGKTTLIRGACRALGVAGPVTSPTFTIGHRYQGRVPISHLDLFRLGSAGPDSPSAVDSEEPGLLDEYLDPGAIVFVEWPDLAAALLASRPPSGRVLRVAIAHAGGDRRSISVEDVDSSPQ